MCASLKIARRSTIGDEIRSIVSRLAVESDDKKAQENCHDLSSDCETYERQTYVCAPFKTAKISDDNVVDCEVNESAW